MTRTTSYIKVSSGVVYRGSARRFYKSAANGCYFFMLCWALCMTHSFALIAEISQVVHLHYAFARSKKPQQNRRQATWRFIACSHMSAVVLLSIILKAACLFDVAHRTPLDIEKSNEAQVRAFGLFQLLPRPAPVGRIA